LADLQKSSKVEELSAAGQLFREYTLTPLTAKTASSINKHNKTFMFIFLMLN